MKIPWTILLLCFSLQSLGGESGRRTNFLLIMADDCTYNNLPIDDEQNAKHRSNSRPGVGFQSRLLSGSYVSTLPGGTLQRPISIAQRLCLESFGRPQTKSVTHYLKPFELLRRACRQSSMHLFLYALRNQVNSNFQ